MSVYNKHSPKTTLKFTLYNYWANYRPRLTNKYVGPAQRHT